MSITFLFGLLIANFVAMLFAMPLLGGDFSKMALLQSNPALLANSKIPLLQMQATVAALAFVVFPYLYLKFLDKEVKIRLNKTTPNYFLLPLVPLLVLILMPSYSPIVEWNANLDLPNFFSGFEVWARAKEDELKNLTLFMTKFETNEELIYGFLAISIAAGIGEEFFFRGVLQNKLHQYGLNIHAAIWISAFIFSAIHFQFYGFFPRVLLGGVFGYLYFWSGNLLFPIIAHIFHNGFTLLMLYLFQQKIIEMNIEKAQSSPIEFILPSAVVGFAVLLFLKKSFEKHKKAHSELEY